MNTYQLLVIVGVVVMSFGVFERLRNRALGGQSIHPDSRAARNRSALIFAVGGAVFIVGLLLRAWG